MEDQSAWTILHHRRLPQLIKLAVRAEAEFIIRRGPVRAQVVSAVVSVVRAQLRSVFIVQGLLLTLWVLHKHLVPRVVEPLLRIDLHLYFLFSKVSF